MKKLLTYGIVLALLLSLCACGGETPETTGPEATAPVQTQPVETKLTETEPAETTVSTQPEKDLKALAESCMDKSVAELYALIGEPESSDYAPSCLGDGEDGNLYYDGFVVYTYREGDEETVVYVE